MDNLREDFEEVSKIYHAQNQVLRAVLGILATAVVTFVPPSHTWLGLLARAATPAVGTAGWVLYRGKRPVVSVAEVHDLLSWWEERASARNARRLSHPPVQPPVTPGSVTRGTPPAPLPPTGTLRPVIPQPATSPPPASRPVTTPAAPASPGASPEPPDHEGSET